MKRCSCCVMPDSRPDIRFEDGVCSACLAYERRSLVDWSERGREFHRLMKQHKTHPAYDCVVASSGGKDSHYIALTARELGYRPLLVTATTDIPTDIGRRNLVNLREQGFDMVEFTPNPVVRRKLMRIALEEIGDIEWPEHAAIFSTPVRLAKEMGIGIVLYGECPQNDLSGGPQDAITLDKRWREEYGGLLGLRPSDLVGREGITARDMWAYEWPDLGPPRRYRLDTTSPVVTSIYGEAHPLAPMALFLGAFFAWDGLENARVARAHGFTGITTEEGLLADSENLDNACIGLHDYFAFLKYGFGRTSVRCSLDIRRGRRTREEAVALARKYDDAYPSEYMGVPLGAVLREIGLTREQFDAICDRFANRALLEKVDERWRLKEEYAL